MKGNLRLKSLVSTIVITWIQCIQILAQKLQIDIVSYFKLGHKYFYLVDLYVDQNLGVLRSTFLCRGMGVDVCLYMEVSSRMKISLPSILDLVYFQWYASIGTPSCSFFSYFTNIALSDWLSFIIIFTLVIHMLPFVFVLSFSFSKTEMLTFGINYRAYLVFVLFLFFLFFQYNWVNLK